MGLVFGGVANASINDGLMMVL